MQIQLADGIFTVPGEVRCMDNSVRGTRKPWYRHVEESCCYWEPPKDVTLEDPFYQEQRSFEEFVSLFADEYEVTQEEAEDEIREEAFRQFAWKGQEYNGI